MKNIEGKLEEAVQGGEKEAGKISDISLMPVIR